MRDDCQISQLSGQAGQRAVIIRQPASKAPVLLSLLAGLLISVPAAIASAQGAPHQVCSIADFGQFVSKFMHLTSEQQFTCVDYPVKNLSKSGRPLKTEKQLKAFLEIDIFVLPPEAMETPPASRPFVSPANNCKIQPRRMGYVYARQPEGMGLSLTEGGTSVLIEVRFARKDGYWVLVGTTGWIDESYPE